MKRIQNLTLLLALLIGGITVTASASETIPGAPAQPSSYFYTGKPYDEDIGGYVFLFRTYSPHVNRWTSADPIGFPDGPNQHFYAPVATTGLDPWGLEEFGKYPGVWINPDQQDIVLAIKANKPAQWQQVNAQLDAQATAKIPAALQNLDTTAFTTKLSKVQLGTLTYDNVTFEGKTGSLKLTISGIRYTDNVQQQNHLSGKHFYSSWIVTTKFTPAE